jgi:hypothetical protein
MFELRRSQPLPRGPEKVHFVKIHQHDKASFIGPCRSDNWPFCASRQQSAEIEKVGGFPDPQCR